MSVMNLAITVRNICLYERTVEQVEDITVGIYCGSEDVWNSLLGGCMTIYWWDLTNQWYPPTEEHPLGILSPKDVANQLRAAGKIK